MTKQNIHGTEYYPGERDARRFFANLKADTSVSSGGKVIGVVNRDVKETPRIIHDTFLKIINNSKNRFRLSTLTSPSADISKEL